MTSTEHPKVYPPIHPKDGSSDASLFVNLGLTRSRADIAFEEYSKTYMQSIEDPDKFWAEQAAKYIEFFVPYKKVLSGGFESGDMHWFSDGKLNICYNCIDRHLPARANQVALIWDGDEPGTGKKYTYGQLAIEVSKVANALKSLGVRKGDVVTIYMPMIPEIAMTMLACARIGAIHSVVFAGFSAESLKGRIIDCNSSFVVTVDEGLRGGKVLKLKQTVDEAIHGCHGLEKVLVFKRTGGSIAWNPKYDVWAHEILPKMRPYCPCEWMDSEDTLFILYTSGSTGKPKGVAHTSAGYLLYATYTCKMSFALEENDIYCCVADCGWITGHSYVVYGPLSNGTTTVVFESLPTYPNAYRYWDVVQKYKVTKFYTAPTAVRALMRHDTHPINDYDLSSLKVLGTVGEPINPEAWRWYFEHVGKKKCSVVDTYWQTENGGHIAANLPGVVPMKPGSCAYPLPGIEFAVVDPSTGAIKEGDNIEGVLCVKKPWPGIARTVYGDHERYMNVYLKPYPGMFFTGDGCRRDLDGYYWITGRVDDVINPSGHRLGTAEIESALVACPEVSEAAVVGFPHDIKGEGIACFVILRNNFHGSSELVAKLKNAVRVAISPIATPDFIVFGELPKTRSGKIMRRILRKIATGEIDSIGDVTTLADPTVVPKLIASFNDAKKLGSSQTLMH